MAEAQVSSSESRPSPEILKENIAKYLRARDESQRVTLQQHIPMIRSHIGQTSTSTSQQRLITVLGDEVIQGVCQHLEEVDAEDFDASTTVLDLTVPGDSIANTLYRLDFGLLMALASLYQQKPQSQSQLVVLSLGAHDTAVESQKHKRQAFKPSQLKALQTLIDTLLCLEENLEIVLVTRIPRADVSLGYVQQAASELILACSKLPADRVFVYEAPLSLKVSHLQSDVALDASGCDILADDLRPAILGLPRGQPHTSDANKLDHQGLGAEDALWPLRPAQDVLNRILHDTDRFDPSQVMVGYEDRHEGIQELPATSWQKDSTDEEFIPMHRIRYFRNVAGGREVLWSRHDRIDRVFSYRR